VCRRFSAGNPVKEDVFFQEQPDDGGYCQGWADSYAPAAKRAGTRALKINRETSFKLN